MMDDDADETPQGDGIEELMQEEPDTLPMVTVPVAVQGSVRVRPQPARASIARNYPLAPVGGVAGEPQQIAGFEPRRSRLLVWVTGTGGPIYLSETQAGAKLAGGAVLPAAGAAALPLMSDSEYWVWSADTANTPVVNTITELWAD